MIEQITLIAVIITIAIAILLLAVSVWKIVQLHNRVHSATAEAEKQQLLLINEQNRTQEFVQQKQELLRQSEQYQQQLMQLQQQLQVSKTQAELWFAQQQQKEQQLIQAELKQQQQQQALLELNTKITRLTTELSEREASYQREIANFEQQKQQLSEHFALLSQEILEAKSKSLQQHNQQSLQHLMQPFQLTLEGFKKEVQDIHHRETKQQGELRQELEQLKNMNIRITNEASELANALRGSQKVQGNWGELMLENVLERSGLRIGVDYRRELELKNEEGKKLRPDVVVFLPQDKQLIIDAKVSLNAYTRYVNTQDDKQRAAALKEHIRAIKDRIQELSSKDYFKLLNSPDMVFMFIPIESAFVDAIKADETIFQLAMENRILLATPTTLLTSLNIVRQLWRYEEQNKNTQLLAEKADSVFKKLKTFLDSFEKIKRALDTAQETYNTAENQLLSGRGNLVKQVNEFKQLAPAITAELPSYFTEKAELEIDLLKSADDSQ